MVNNESYYYYFIWSWFFQKATLAETIDKSVLSNAILTGCELRNNGNLIKNQVLF